ncbi:hypothetical protein ACFVSU_12585 [Microbacterium sp. NPDC058062]|uniref:hypothetical protein n=1 Tax=Microbacterium sp. NPDC058062 TaxID=3346320 RepID=UPI0036DC96D0
MLDWGILGEEKFNRAAELLITKTIELDNPGLVVEAVDGRGGDAGIDLDVRVRRTGQLVAIYQLKHFPGGFSGDRKTTRRAQIRSSFKAALQHDPAKWVLVIPANFTPGERRFVNGLNGRLHRPRIGRIGSTRLDEMLTQFPEVEDYINRDANLAALQLVGRESALLTRPDDLTTEIDRLQERISARSLYWGTEFSTLDGVRIERLVARRADAHEREPLRITMETDFTNATELAEHYRQAIDYGLLEPLQFSADVVTRFERHGPEWFAGVVDVLGVELVPLDNDLDLAVKVVLRSAHNKTLAQPTALRVRASTGAKGAQLKLLVCKGVEFAFYFDKHAPDGGTMKFDVALQGLSGAEANRALNFLTALSHARQLTLAIESVQPFTVGFDEGNPAPPASLVEFAEDLAAIERELGIEFSVPTTGPSDFDRIWARVIRRFFEGIGSLVPGVDDLSFTVTPPLRERDEEWLTSEGLPYSANPDEWTWELLGQELLLSDVTFAVGCGRVVDGGAHVAALKADPITPRTVRFAPLEEHGGVVIFSRALNNMKEEIEVRPWGLSGIDEHPRFALTGEGDAA